MPGTTALFAGKGYRHEAAPSTTPVPRVRPKRKRKKRHAVALVALKVPRFLPSDPSAAEVLSNLFAAMFQNGKRPARPAPWYSDGTHLVYVYAAPRRLKTALTRAGVTLAPLTDPDAFPAEALDVRGGTRGWGLPLEGTVTAGLLGHKPVRPPRLPFRVLSWFTEERHDPPPRVPALTDVLRGEDALAEFLYLRLGGRRWRGSGSRLRLDGHEGKFCKRLGVWFCHVFTSEGGYWLTMDDLARLVFPDSPSPLLAAAWHAGVLEATAAKILEVNRAILRSVLSSPAVQTIGIHPGLYTDCSKEHGDPRESIVRVWDRISAHFLAAARRGFGREGWSCRFLAKEVNLPFSEVNQIVNWFCVIGLLKKLAWQKHNGRPQTFTLCAPSEEMVWRRWASVGYAGPFALSAEKLARHWPAECVREVYRRA